VDENGYPGMELDRMMEYPGAPRQRTGGASSLSADEGMGSGKPCDGPEQWSEWKQEEDVAFQQYSTMFSKATRPDRLKDRAAPRPCEADRPPTIYESVGEAARWGWQVAGI
jgi:hypothetical protein